MADKKQSRRKLLKSIAAGSGVAVAGKSLPESWSKPVVDAVLLPAHGATTDDTGSGGPEVTTTAQATTTAQCCLTAGYYCTTIGGEEFIPMIIDVTAAGGVSVKTGPGGDETGIGAGSVSCAGGSFSITLSGDGHIVTGDVICGQKRIPGTIVLYGAGEPEDYIAT